MTYVSIMLYIVQPEHQYVIVLLYSFIYMLYLFQVGALFAWIMNKCNVQQSI